MTDESREYAAGQIWQYETRESEEASRIIILKIERVLWEEVIIHIAVVGVKIKNPHKPEGLSTKIGHLPFSEAAINESLTSLESAENELPDYLDGYNQWRKTYKSGEGSIFSVTVKEAVAYVEGILNQ